MLEQLANTKQTITIPLEEYVQLVADQRFLNALLAQGVDNWDGYELALDELGDDR